MALRSLGQPPIDGDRPLGLLLAERLPHPLDRVDRAEEGRVVLGDAAHRATIGRLERREQLAPERVGQPLAGRVEEHVGDLVAAALGQRLRFGKRLLLSGVTKVSKVRFTQEAF